MCVLCRSRLPKESLVRLYLRREGEGEAGVLDLDLRGKGPGRGAYLCRRAEAWLDPSLPHRLRSALKCPSIDDASLERVQRKMTHEAPAGYALCAREGPPSP